MKHDPVTKDPAERVGLALWFYSAVVLAVTTVSWIVYRESGAVAWWYRPLFDFSDHFHDLTNYYGKMAHLRDGAAALGQGFPVYNYGAPAAYVYRFLLFGLGGNIGRTYGAILVLSACLLGGIAWWSIRSTRARAGALAAIAVTTLLGYPIWFVIDRGNIEGIVWIFSAVGLCMLLQQRYWAAAGLIGIASALKPFPAIFFLLLLWARRFKEVALGVVVAVALTIFALWALGPSPLQAYRDLEPGLAQYMNTYILHIVPPYEARFDHSWMDGVKSLQTMNTVGALDPAKASDDGKEWSSLPPGLLITSSSLTRAYAPVTAVALAMIIMFFVRMPMLNRMTALAVMVTVLPFSASDYTLLHLYVPFGAFVVFAVREIATGRVALSNQALFSLSAIYGLLFAPLTLLKLYAGDAKLVLLLALLFVVARTPMPSRTFGDAVPQS